MRTTILLLSLISIAPSLGAQTSSRVTVNGYLTQAYGIADREMAMGLTREGTADYRRAAILARYEASPTDHFVLQLAHRRLGDSPTMQVEENVKVDMAFFQHRFSNGTNVRVGKFAMPWGIYNEVRYAGTLTPFFRAPFMIYRDGTYQSETVDGVSMSHAFRTGDSWETTVDVYGGSFDQAEFGGIYPSNSAPVYAGATLRSKNALGAQLWLSTPLEGLRLGVSGRRQTDLGGLYERPEGGANSRLWIGSVDGSFDRWSFRAEHQGMKTFGFEMSAHYAQAGVRLLPWMSLNGQAEMRDEKLRYSPSSPWIDVKAGRDNALGLNFHLADKTVLKIEGHAVKGYGLMYERVVDSSRPAITSAYFISSLSVAF